MGQPPSMSWYHMRKQSPALRIGGIFYNLRRGADLMYKLECDYENKSINKLKNNLGEIKWDLEQARSAFYQSSRLCSSLLFSQFPEIRNSIELIITNAIDSYEKAANQIPEFKDADRVGESGKNTYELMTDILSRVETKDE